MKQYLYNLATDKTTGVLAAVMKFFLLILSFIYGIIIRLMIFLSYRKQYRMKCKVVSVGNITLGGTGKTPLVKLIAQYLKEHGHRPAIVSRGYKKQVTSHKSQVTSYEAMGDEPFMLKESLVDVPVLVGADRIKSMENSLAVDSRIDTFILDDGFQQWKIKKDLEIVTIDAVNPFGNRHMLPRGILRQPISTLKKADMFVLTKTDISNQLEVIKSFLTGINPDALIVETAHEPVALYPLQRKNELLDMRAFSGKNVSLACGIAGPEYFFKTVKKIGVNIGLVFNFPDHHEYSLAQIKDMAMQSEDKGIDIIITTEKDAARLRHLPGNDYKIQILVLVIKLKIIKNEQGFDKRLLSL